MGLADLKRYIRESTPASYGSKSTSYYRAQNGSFLELYREFGLGELTRARVSEYARFQDAYAKRWLRDILAVSNYEAFVLQKGVFQKQFPGSSLSAELNVSHVNRIYLRLYNALEQNKVRSIAELSRDVAQYLKLSRDKNSGHYRSVKILSEFIGQSLAYVDSSGGISPRRFSRSFVGFDTKEEPDRFKILPNGKCVKYVRRGSLIGGSWKRRYIDCPQVSLMVWVDGTEVYNSGPIKKYSDDSLSQEFQFQWLPGQTIKLVLSNTSGQTREVETSGLLGINSLAKRKRFPDSSASVSFAESKLIFPPLPAP